MFAWILLYLMELYCVTVLSVKELSLTAALCPAEKENSLARYIFLFSKLRKQSWPGLSSSKNSPNTSIPYHTTCLSVSFNFPIAAQGRTLQVWELGIQKSKTSSQEKAAFHSKASNKSSSDCLIKPLAELARPPFMFCCHVLWRFMWNHSKDEVMKGKFNSEFKEGSGQKTLDTHNFL